MGSGRVMEDGDIVSFPGSSHSAKRLVKLLIALVFFEEWPFSFLSFTHLLALSLPGQSVKPLHWTFKALSLICSLIVC